MEELCEEVLVGYPGVASSLKVPVFPSKPCQMTSRLVGKAYVVVGKASGALHTMAVLQTYQANLLNDLDQGEGLSPEVVLDLRRSKDLALHATKQTAFAINCSMAVMVATESHLWLNFSSIENNLLPQSNPLASLVLP